MKDFFRYWLQKPGTVAVFIALLFAAAFNFIATDVLNKSYAASQFPAPYFVAQLSFDPDRIGRWYAYLIERGTLDVYVRTQHIDFLFIVSTVFLHFLALVFVARLFPPDSRWRRAMVICAALSCIAPVADALENLVSYVMLAEPMSFHRAWAYVYSTFAALKFAMFAFAYLAFATGLIAAAVHATYRRLSPAHFR